MAQKVTYETISNPMLLLKLLNELCEGIEKLAEKLDDEAQVSANNYESTFEGYVKRTV